MDLLCTASVPSSSSSYTSVSASSLLKSFPSTFDGRNPAFLKFPTNITTNSNNHHNLNTTTPTFPPFPNTISTTISTVSTFSSSAAATASQRDYAFDNISGDDGAKRHLSSSAARIFIRGLSNSTSAGFLAKTFSQFGEVRYVKIIINQCTMQSLGLAYIWFTCKESANIAVKEMDGKFVDGRFISVEYARPESYARKTRSNSFLFRPK